MRKLLFKLFLFIRVRSIIWYILQYLEHSYIQYLQIQKKNKEKFNTTERYK